MTPREFIRQVVADWDAEFMNEDGREEFVDEWELVFLENFE